MPADKYKGQDRGEVGVSETDAVEFSVVNVNYQGKSMDVQFPSKAAAAAGVVACVNGHPNVPDPTTGEISCGCGSTEVSA